MSLHTLTHTHTYTHTRTHIHTHTHAHTHVYVFLYVYLCFVSKLERKEGETLLEICTGPGLGMEEALLYKVCLSVFMCRVCVWAFGCNASLGVMLVWV